MSISFDGILDVGISLAVIYLMLSLLCTTLNEIAATLLSLRAKSLSVAVRKILEDDGALLSRFYNNGLIRGSISSSQKSPTEKIGIPEPKDHSSYLDSRTFAMALLGSLEPGTSIALEADIKRLVDALPADGTSPLPSGLKDVLNAALVTAKGDIHKLRDTIAEWFDASMDRLSGNYKRQLRWLSFGVGFVVAGLLNVDSIAVGKAVWNDDNLRQQLTDSAEGLLSASAPRCVLPAKPTTATEAETTTETEAAGTESAGTEAAGRDKPDLQCQLAVLSEQLEQLRPLPIGWWQAPEVAGDANATNASAATVDEMISGDWLLRLVGWLLTAFALSLGAPFWFDVLSKFMNVRGAGAKPKPVDEKPAGT